jgi:hypothetical protein
MNFSRITIHPYQMNGMPCFYQTIFHFTPRNDNQLTLLSIKVTYFVKPILTLFLLDKPTGLFPKGLTRWPLQEMRGICS